MPASFMLIMTTGPRPDAWPDAAAGRLAGRCCRTPGRTLLPDALDSGFHGVRTHWIRGFMAFQLARRTGW
jgi:hypothetical protein